MNQPIQDSDFRSLPLLDRDDLNSDQFEPIEYFYGEWSAEIRAVGQILNEFIQILDPELVFEVTVDPEFQKNFSNMLDQVQFRATNSDLQINNKIVSMINYPNQNLIVFNIKRWDSNRSNLELKTHIVLHEFLGLLEIDDSKYQLSTQLLHLLLANNKSLVGQYLIYTRNTLNLEGLSLIVEDFLSKTIFVGTLNGKAIQGTYGNGEFLISESELGFIQGTLNFDGGLTGTINPESLNPIPLIGLRKKVVKYEL